MSRRASDTISRQRRDLARWLAEWRLDRRLRDAPRPEPDLQDGAGKAPAANALIGALQPPVVGEIRLLFPVAGAPDTGPLYGAVLARRGPDVLWAPFGRFSVPATPGEWRTGLRTPPVRVLCLWNSRWLAAAVLRLSWRAGRFDPARVAAALEVLERYRSGATSGTTGPGDVGPPVRHPLDPRHEYQLEEADRLAEHLTALEARLAVVAPGSAACATTYESQDAGNALLAAESGASYGGKRRGGRRRRGRRKRG
jgi:hypothetical protein